MKILVKEQILPSLTFSDDEICIECVKGKLTKPKKKGATRSSDLLEIIHTDICGPFTHQTIDGNCYFITFIDDHSRFGYLYLIAEKSQAFEMFKIFQNEVERQLEKKIKEDDGLDLLLGYPARSKGFRFYCPNYGTRIVENCCAKFIEHEENATRNEDFIFEEEGDVALAVIENAEQEVTPLIPLSETVLENPQFEEPIEPQEQTIENPELDDPQEPVQLRRSDRPRRSTTTSDYVYL
ncbi:unnamed protein product, partial [Prunus brigantina]